ncbi:MAG TPA: DNA repair protein RecN [Clostridiales bacterium]|nr:DNA repair protein RecN [Clostridiales bacterium]
MLKNIQIKNVALIEEASIEFEKGLNVLSGETGSGKSVILDSLNFVLGAKADKSMIRNGSDFCMVKAEFDVKNNPFIKRELDALDIDCDDDLIVSRKFSLSGASSIRINGEPVTLTGLKNVTGHLVDVHGQSEHFYLLKEANQLALIDAYGGEKIAKAKEELSKEISALKNVLSELNKLGGDDGQRALRLDILKYQVNEIKESDVKEYEYEDLIALKAKLSNQEKISEALNETKQALSGEGAATDGVSYARNAISRISNLDKSYADILTRLENAYAEIEDISETVSGFMDDFDFSEADLDRTEERISLIKNLFKKYGGSYNELIAFESNAEKEIEKLENFDKLAEELLVKKTELSAKVYSLYIKLSSLRKDFAKDFSEKVACEIRELNMKNAAFDVKFNELPEFNKEKDDIKISENGLDEISFMFSANLGEPLKSLSKIISGGEMSRFMLAIKSRTAKYSEISTLVFDEIDAGISGETAKVVGEKFLKLSEDVQLIAVSHLPQIVALGDNNLLIKKIEMDGKTVSVIEKINGEKLVAEIVRLIGGTSESPSAIAHAKELIKNADRLKASF